MGSKTITLTEALRFLPQQECHVAADEIESLRTQLAAAEARVVELEGSVRRLVEEELPLLRVRRWRDMNVEDKNPMPFKKAESERTGHMVPDPLGGWVSAPMIQTKLMRLLETPND